jgi:hypothetical protein
MVWFAGKAGAVVVLALFFAKVGQLIHRRK